MKPYRFTLALLLLGAALIAAGCKGKPAEDEASIKERLNEKGTMDVMEQVSKAPDYQPPADGHLTDKQVKMYIDVRQRAQKIREVAYKNLKAKDDQAKKEKRNVGFFEAMKAVGDVADVATADLRAAQELGHNPKEYQWVNEQVLEAKMLQTTRALNQQVAQGQQSLINMLEEQKKQATDDAQRAEIDKQIQELKSNTGEVPDSNPAKEFNAQLIARYKDDFDRLQSEDQRIAEELQKSGNQGGGQ
ncbi:MAG TPA: hypothetical protein VGG03_05820 [Thermoanaerobaculia bacterium]|jgi:hypothetical protein